MYDIDDRSPVSFRSLFVIFIVLQRHQVECFSLNNKEDRIIPFNDYSTLNLI